MGVLRAGADSAESLRTCRTVHCGCVTLFLNSKDYKLANAKMHGKLSERLDADVFRNQQTLLKMKRYLREQDAP